MQSANKTVFFFGKNQFELSTNSYINPKKKKMNILLIAIIEPTHKSYLPNNKNMKFPIATKKKTHKAN